MIIIFTDGSARGNPGPGGWGAIVLTDGKAVELGGGEEHTTNNRMELMAVISALDFLSRPSTGSINSPQAGSGQESEMTIYTDSAYVVNGITRWVIGWKKNKWKTSQKEDVLNKDLWERLDEARKHKTIDWKLIKGHSGTAGNERCDVIATSFADKVPVVLYNGSRERYGVDVNVKFPISNDKSKSKSKTKAHSYISVVDGVIKVHKTWEECKARVHGVNAKYKKAVSPEDEEKIMKEFKDNF